jgi:acetamidase/formamidase
MRKVIFVLLLVPELLVAPNARPQDAQEGAHPGNPAISGRWIVTTDSYGTPSYYLLELKQEGDKLGGTFRGDALEGTLQGNSIQFLAKGGNNRTEEGKGTVRDGTLSGTVIFAYPGEPPITSPFTAKLIPPRGSRPPQRYEFTPTTFYRQFSAANKPVLTIFPGDTVHTTTIDAGGNDEKGVKRALGGNPETGPFYVESAVPGDTLVVHLTRVRLNRDWAGSDDAVVEDGLDSYLAVMMKDGGKPVRWHLDTERGVATPENPAEHLARYAVPLRPMLGCVGVAPNPRGAAPDTTDSGPWGGNMDFNEIVEGATVYLPISVPGALLYMGDGHAAQGDGELNGNALETSMDVEFTVDVIPKKSIMGPRVESAGYIMAMGLSGSLDDAFRDATSSMARWLTDDYKLTPSEVAQVLGTSAEYKISEIADRNSAIILKINKQRLQPLTPAAK